MNLAEQIPYTANDPEMVHRPAHISPAEWAARVELAAAYRIFDHLGWVELIYNHITVRVPGPETHFLINPFGLWYREVTASNLVKVDLAGNIIGQSEWPVNPAGFVPHSAIHGAVADAHCVMHTHTTAGMSVACLEEGLEYTNFYSCQLYGRVAYHEFEGTTVRADEGERMLASIGTKQAVILRNHGLLVHHRTVPAAFFLMWNLQRACEIQMATNGMNRTPLIIPPEIGERGAKAAESFIKKDDYGQDAFAALKRLVTQKDPSYLT